MFSCRVALHHILNIAVKNVKGKAVAPRQYDYKPMLVHTHKPDTQPLQVHIPKMVKEGKLLEASWFVFSAGALKMLENC